MTSPAPITVFLADDQDLVRSGFAMILDAAPGFMVTGEAADGEAAIRQLEAAPADVILMDIRMRGMGGVAATAEIKRRSPRSRVLMLTTFDDDEALYAALDAGASGFLLKDCRAEELLTAIRTVHQGESVIAPAMTRRLLERVAARPGGWGALGAKGTSHGDTPTEVTAVPPDPRVRLLTPREVEVLSAVGRGLSNGEIAAELFLAENTVKTHLARIMHKVVARDRVSLVLTAHAMGLVDLRQGE